MIEIANETMKKTKQLPVVRQVDAVVSNPQPL